MTHNEAVSFIQNAIHASTPKNWADLGCGSGTFTRALIGLLPEGSHITAVDREQQRLNIPGVDFVKADFEKDELGLARLDGILLANAIHYVPDKEFLIRKLEILFAGSPRFLVIEYDTDKANPWVPYPISFHQLQTLFRNLGYEHIIKLNVRPSAYRSGLMYCALITKY
jgi:ubiquinone/menaquinone biosynthesis C-methylase UbiE